MKLDELEKLAREATPGRWWVTDSGVRDQGGYICFTLRAQRYEGQDERYERETAERAANANLIAAANPAQILRLVSIARAAEKASIFFESYSSQNEVGQSRLESECEDVLAALREALGETK